MEKTVRDHVLWALDELESRSLKSFRNKLNDCTVKEGYQRIPRGQLENKDPEDLTTLILKNYGDSYGAELTLSILKAINENKVAADFEKLLANGKTGRRFSIIDSSASCSGPKKHFVAKHREALISRMYIVEGVLDGLLEENLLNHEQYDRVRCQRTSQEKMRELYSYMRGWGDNHKDRLYNCLLKNNKPLIEDLKDRERAPN
ncbi:unnamed protein product [Staurois parvus]|uniref:Apoptosis-associated speck-like protein containing a CARD n=1 Tax=Staurois parvus TaxID=386267 RepID=A0ABN9AIM9_9NEOB|nr:unnamed protein product [Staurois parvus]